MVFGTPTIGRPFSNSACAMRCEPSPPMLITRVDADAVQPADQLVGAVDDLEAAVGPAQRKLERAAGVGGAEDGAAAHQQAAHRVQVERQQPHRIVEDAVERLDAADHLPVVAVDRALHDGADDGVRAPVRRRRRS